jgi:hypothetical protein
LSSSTALLEGRGGVLEEQVDALAVLFAGLLGQQQRQLAAAQVERRVVAALLGDAVEQRQCAIEVAFGGLGLGRAGDLGERVGGAALQRRGYRRRLAVVAALRCAAAPAASRRSYG